MSDVCQESLKRRSRGEEACSSAVSVGAAMLRPSCLASSLSKGLSSSPALHFLDANSFADVLGISPAFRQKETIRWNSALHLYKRMSAHDLTNLPDDFAASALIADAFDDNSDGVVTNREDGLPPVSNPFGARPTTSGVKPGAYGFLTPQTSVLAPPERRRSGSYASPGESSLNSLELEAIAAVHELQFAVKDIFVSELLPRTSELIFLNVTTLEGQAYCVELTLKGWRVTSMRHDCMNGDMNYIQLHTTYFETIYALMDNISVGYREKFSRALADKLRLLQQQSRADDILDFLSDDSGAIIVNVRASSEENRPSPDKEVLR